MCYFMQTFKNVDVIVTPTTGYDCHLLTLFLCSYGVKGDVLN